MKTSAKNLSLSALMLLTALFVGCNNSDNGDNSSNDDSSGGKTAGIIKPVRVSEVSDEVADFFEKYLPPIAGMAVSECFFVNDEDDKCLIINSDKELQAITNSSVRLPAIDLGIHTLIIGQHTVPMTSYRVLSQNIDIKSNQITLNLSVKVPEESYQALSKQYYWGLYPKFSPKPIKVNVIYEK